MDPYKGIKLVWLQKGSLKDPVLILVTHLACCKGNNNQNYHCSCSSPQLATWQVDINNAFLYGDLTKLVFMQQPPSFENATTPTYVRKLNKALYGLKQAPWAYFTKLTSTLTMWDFTASKSDSSLMIYASKGNLFSYLLKLMTELSQGTTINLFQSSSMIFITNLHSKIWASFITFLGLK